MDDELRTDSESSIPSVHPQVESLRILASRVKFQGGNTLLHQFVLDHSHPNKAPSNSFLNAVLRSMRNLPGHVVNALNDEGCTALHLAVTMNNLPLVQKLLSRVAHIDVNAKTGYQIMHSGNGALHLAAENGNTCIAEELLHGGADIHLLNRWNKSPLYVAAEAGCLDAVKLLANEGADVNLGLCSAALSGHLEVVEFLVSSGADINFVTCDKLRLTPLCGASRGHLAIVEYLVSKGADVNITNIDGWTPLHFAASKKHLKIVEYLVENGADVNARDKFDINPLHIASMYGKSKNVAYLLDHGADIHARNDEGETPLHMAFGPSKKESVTLELLISRGSDVNAQDQRNITPLHWAVENGDSKIVELLINQGAYINAQDGRNNTPLHYVVRKRNEILFRFLVFVRKHQVAIGWENLEIVTSLLDRGTDLLAVHREGEILVFPAVHEEILLSVGFLTKKRKVWNPTYEGKCYRKLSNVIRILLNKGADTSVRNEDGETPLDLARNQRCINILKRLTIF